MRLIQNRTLSLREFAHQGNLEHKMFIRCSIEGPAIINAVEFVEIIGCFFTGYGTGKQSISFGKGIQFGVSAINARHCRFMNCTFRNVTVVFPGAKSFFNPSTEWCVIRR